MSLTKRIRIRRERKGANIETAPFYNHEKSAHSFLLSPQPNCMFVHNTVAFLHSSFCIDDNIISRLSKMGKKKSNANKQKQAKARAATQKRRSNAKLNVPIVSSDGIMNKNDSKTVPRKVQKKLKGANPKKNNSEDKDFEDEYRSLQERHFHAQIKKQKSTKTLEMAPATLQVNQKPTTEQLVSDATSHLHGMQELGQASMLSGTAIGGNPNSNLLQVLAAQKRHENYLAQQEAAKPRNVGEGNNYWALQDDDSDGEREKPDSIKAFNFAAPSFALPTTSTILGGSGFGTIADDDDPDL